MAKETVICTYRVREDAEEAFRELLAERDGRPKWEFPHYRRQEI
ncbi:hypothetical protein ACIA58_39910 [Kribbella sp. NPDC051586]